MYPLFRLVANFNGSLLILFAFLFSPAASLYPNPTDLSHQQYNQHRTDDETESISVERTRSIALLFSFIQCFPNNSNGVLDDASQKLLHIHQTFHPQAHLHNYANLTHIQNLVELVKEMEETRTPNNIPFTNAPQDISDLSVILKVLYFNADNWPLFYDTVVWLLERVNTAQLFWALMIVSAEKFSDTVTVPSAVEIFPQLFVPKNLVLQAAGLEKMVSPESPLDYWMSDPGLNEFHVHWHMDNPFWWDEKVYGVVRHRKGELFLYMHHQMMCRYTAELLSNGLPETEPLGLQPNYSIPEGYHPNIVNINYANFFSRPDNEQIGTFDNNGTTLAVLSNYYELLSQGIQQGYFIGPDGSHILLQGERGMELLGATVESSSVYSADLALYGSFHNYMHRLLAGMLKPTAFPLPGIQAHSETAMRDPAFYNIHKRVEQLFLGYKQTVAAYTQDELDFSGVSILTVDLISRPHWNHNKMWRPTSKEVNWPFPEEFSSQTPVLTTYFRTETFDISNAARPCRTIDDNPVPVQVTVLDHVPFSYVIGVQSMRSEAVYGMVRIFMWPEYNVNGELLQGDAAHERAIELDRFRVRINPSGPTIIKRSSLDSSLTRVEPSPGIKALYTVKSGSNLLTKPAIRRACAFPNNLLLPKGTKNGLPFKLVVYISDETDAESIEENQYPHYPLCGALNGLPFPDKRSMGFPFDRPGTRFNVTPVLEHSPIFGGLPIMNNIKETKVVIKHDE